MSVCLCRQSGTLVGWKGDAQCNVTVVFQHDLKDPLTQLVFRSVEEHRQQPNVDLGSVLQLFVMTRGNSKADPEATWPCPPSALRIYFAP